MASNYSFDVVSDVDFQEVDNAVNQTVKEITQRYDFKGSKTEVLFSQSDEEIKIATDDEFKLNAVADILRGKFIKRGIPAKNLDFGKVENASLGTVRQKVKIVKGISKDKAKLIISDIKDSKLKVQAQIQDIQLRVIGKDKDDLQKAIALLKSKDYGIELQFTNYR